MGGFFNNSPPFRDGKGENNLTAGERAVMAYVKEGHGKIAPAGRGLSARRYVTAGSEEPTSMGYR